MTPILITPLYAGLVALLMAVLSTATAIQRGTHDVALGNGGKPALALGIRRFGNLSEYAAMAVLLLLLMELTGVDPWWLHAYGITLVALRVLHPFVLYDRSDVPLWRKTGRFIAAAGTAALILAAGLVLMF